MQPHAHHAIQITLAPTHPVQLKGGRDAAWQEVSAAIVMPDRPHQFDGCGQAVAMVFVEPETLAGRALLARYGHRDLWPLHDDALHARATALHAAFMARADDGALVMRARQVIDYLAGTAPAPAPVDARVSAALDWIREQLDADITLAQAAAIAHLSPSRFRHLFVEQTGISFRAYLLWARVGVAMAAGMAGGSWTQAAQQAGFADSAHLSRTCRRMFGLAPTMLVSE
ncbi:MAG TPA: AraC family transcriptional regulator [Luteimonas sp.]|nr:AraC family transcriptional regulator [Luteimonas sp.]HRO26826.1 AraC family transcriptional regulator [Luteimonas sp.]HRP71664.1 AraC family transcriptional regulator [Luteimonas sp.]